MASPKSERPFEADDLEDICRKRSEEYQNLKASYETWCVDQQQKLQAETEELGDELRQLKKRFTDMELAYARATEELEQLLSRPWAQRDGSPDIEELFAEGDRRNAELRRIAAIRDSPGEDKKAILREIEKIQNKLEGLPAAYDLIRKKETRGLREKLEQLWQRQSQPDFSATPQESPDDAVQRQNKLLIGTSTLTNEEFSAPFFPSAQEDRRKRSVSLETISSTEFKQSVFPLRPELFSPPGHPRVRPGTAITGTMPASSSNEHQKQDPAPSPTATRFERADKSLLPITQADSRQVKSEYAGSHSPERVKDQLSSTQQAQVTETVVITSARSARREVPKPQRRARRTMGIAWSRWGQASIPDSDSDLPIAKKQKTEKTILFDEVSTESRDWRSSDKIYSMVEFPSGSSRWYIIPCSKHCTSFPTAMGAVRHLNSRGHGHAQLSTHESVRELGILVVDCDAEKSDRNNDEFDRATEQGYRPKHGCNNDNCPVHRLSSRDQRQLSEDLEGSEMDSYEAHTKVLRGGGGNARTAKLGQQPSPPTAAWEPTLGEICQAYWAGDHSWYPATVLPWGDLGEVGLVGSLDETDLFKKRLPSCFALEDSQDGLRIVGWKEDFKVNGRRASERKFPCMFFEGMFKAASHDEESPPPLQNLAWVMAKHLRPMEYRHSDGHHFNEAGLNEARAFKERLVMLKSKGTGEDSRFSPLSVDSDSDAAGARQSRSKQSMQHKVMKMEQDLDFTL